MANEEVKKLTARIDALCMENQLCRARLDKLEEYKHGLEALYVDDPVETAKRVKKIRAIADVMRGIVLEDGY